MRANLPGTRRVGEMRILFGECVAFILLIYLLQVCDEDISGGECGLRGPSPLACGLKQ